MKFAPYHLHRLKKQKVSPPINTPRLQESETREHYEHVVKEKFDNLQNVQHTNTQQRWDEAVSTIIETVEEVLGLKTTVNNNNNRINDEKIAKMSQEQKKLRLVISSCHGTEKIQKMRNERNRLLKKIRTKTTTNRGREIDEKIKEIDELHDESKMFRAVKALNRKKFENPFVHDKDGKNITNPNEIYRTVSNHFKNHFYDENVKKVSPFVGEPKTLRTAITVGEVTRAIKKLNNNRAAGPDGISAELVKHTPTEVHEFIRNILNDVLENHHELDFGRGILVALQKTGKAKGPVKNLRPVILLLIIRKMLSNITLERIKPNYERYISKSQSAYRSNRSTGDVVWGHRWIAAKIQKEDTKVFITGLDMSSAFDTIIREDLIKVLENILHEDEVRMVRMLLSNTTLDIKISGVDTG